MYKELPIYQRTFVLVKPDGVQRGLVGDVVARFERKGLKLVAMKMVWPTEEQVAKHYEWPEADMIKLGERTKQGFIEKGIQDDREPMAIAKWVHGMLLEYVSGGPVVAMVIEGAHAVDHVRKLRGHTNPLAADVGTISGDYTVDSYQLADAAQRAIRNLVHVSGSPEEAQREIGIWFKSEEIHDYSSAIEQIVYSKEWESSQKGKGAQSKAA
jgi:nucleoside-diphosphate kinase